MRGTTSQLPTTPRPRLTIRTSPIGPMCKIQI
jgi:hypothetical protein